MSTSFNSVLQKKILPHIAAVVVFFLVCFVYFAPQFQGKEIPSSDVVQWKGMAAEVVEYRKQHDEQILWTNALFGGMPVYQLSLKQDRNLLQWFNKFFRGFLLYPAGYFMMMMIGFYILLLALGVDPWLSMVGAVAFGLSTNNFVLLEAGHNSKLKAIAYAAPVIAGMVLTFRKNKWLGTALFALAMGLNIYSNHYQMTYYLGILLGIYWLVELFGAINKNTLASFAQSTGLLLLGGLLAIGASMQKFWPTNEYAKETMRGGVVLEQSADASSENKEGGLKRDYAMNWSNGWADLWSMVVPGVVGGSSGEKVSKESAINKAFAARGLSVPKAPLYWGKLPGTSGPNYMGAVVWVLFLFGMIVVKHRIKWWLLAGIILTALLSLGKNFGMLSDLFYYYVPYYAKFRSPNSILTVTAVLVPIVGFMGASDLLKGKIMAKEAIRAILISAGVVGGIGLIMALVGGSLFSFEGASDVQYGQRGYDIDALISDRKSLLRSDAFRTLLFAVLAGGALFTVAKSYLNRYLAIGLIFALVAADLWPVGQRYVDRDSFEEPKKIQRDAAPTRADQSIMADNDPHFRVFNVTRDPWNDAMTSYFHKSVGGYHPAKLRRYNDVIEKHLANNNQGVINMLNTKYYITNGSDNQPQAQRNPGALGNAWFVSSIQTASSNNDEINALTQLDPVSTAVVHNEFSDYLGGATSFQKNGSIQLTNYHPDKLTYSTNSTSEQFAVFSEVWYGPGKGWTARIDGEPVDHIRVNYLLRGLKIPAGNHTVEFEFKPKSYYTGRMVSLICSLLVILGLLFAMFKAFTSWKNDTETQLATMPEPKVKTKKVAPTKSKKKTTTAKKKSTSIKKKKKK